MFKISGAVCLLLGLYTSGKWLKEVYNNAFLMMQELNYPCCPAEASTARILRACRAKVQNIQEGKPAHASHEGMQMGTQRGMDARTLQQSSTHLLQELCETCGPAELLNARVFKSLQDATTDCPGGQTSAPLPAGNANSSGAQPVGPALPVWS